MLKTRETKTNGCFGEKYYRMEMGCKKYVVFQVIPLCLEKNCSKVILVCLPFHKKSLDSSLLFLYEKKCLLFVLVYPPPPPRSRRHHDAVPYRVTSTKSPRIHQVIISLTTLTRVISANSN